MTTPAYRSILERLRQAFPQPVSDREHDAYFVFSIMRALNQVDSMKSAAPILGQSRALDYRAARQARVANDLADLETVTSTSVEQLRGMPIWGHPNTQVNVVAPPSIASIIGALLPTIYNPNLVSDDTSFGLAQAENTVAAMTAALIGYDAKRARGLFTFGGTGTIWIGRTES